jgi:outer membrane protein insertion porin family/translocation and assembly module TamA
MTDVARESQRPARRPWLFALFTHVAVLALFASLLGCPASLPHGQLALDAVDVDGNKEIAADDVKGAMASEPTSKVLGVRLWWVDYGLYQRAILEKDLQRVERYYRARGFFETRVRAGRVVPTGTRSVKVQIVVEEGPRVRIGALRTPGWEALPSALRERILGAWQLALEAPFDEDVYARSGEIAVRVLTEAGYAHAAVKLSVEVDLVTHRATVRAELDAGPLCTFGAITVVGLRELSEGAVRLVLALEPGKAYSTLTIRGARNALFELSIFDTVQIEPDLSDRSATSIPLRVTVTESKLRSVKLGPGFLLDPLRDDVHVVASWEHRNFLGGLRDLTLSARPLLMLKPGLFSVKSARPGFSADGQLRQPSFLEGRTTGSVSTSFAILPDPTNDYRTTSLRGSLGVDRRFGPSVALGLYYRRGFDVPVAYAGGYLPPNVLPGNRSSVQIGYLELLASVDLRDDPLIPRRGLYASVSLQYAMATKLFYGGDFGDVRVQPEIRLFAPLSKHVVLAFRLMAGFVFPRNYSPHDPGRRTPDSTDPSSYDPDTSGDVPYWRAFFSGGASSNRGYATRQIGLRDCAPFEGGRELGQDCSVVTGGASVWESSVELRFDLTGPLSGVLFVDASDVSRGVFDVRLGRPHLSTGPGLRYRTPVGPVRLDFGWRIPGAQLLGGTLDPRETPQPFSLGFTGPFALHVSLGEAF